MPWIPSASWPWRLGLAAINVLQSMWGLLAQGWGADHIFQHLREVGDWVPRAIVRDDVRTMRRSMREGQAAFFWPANALVAEEEIPIAPLDIDRRYRAVFEFAVTDPDTGETETRWMTQYYDHLVTSADMEADAYDLMDTYMSESGLAVDTVALSSFHRGGGIEE